ncbi:reverse transcriptase [Purpureocillium lavendulum]|uniref:Reverse transcriptase n=1 Tax=Purpureocillium lavendulum TaxID=1247861 RepID=A0AB34FDX6_9HYPO|nr:reverse transcriptase [Purpureocillium lavendulum]
METEWEVWIKQVPSKDDMNIKNPLAWWVDRRHIWPILSKLALNIFSTPAMSAEPERVFSDGGELITDKRNGLGDDTVEAEMVGEVRQAIELEMRAKDGRAAWRCAAVVRDARAAERIKVIFRDENELKQVKEAAQKTAVVGARVMRDQLYPVKVDNANRSRVLDAEGNVLPGAAEALGAENRVNIAKVSWLSNKDSGKAYGSMVVYVTKESDARRLVDGHNFDLAGESATTNVFERRTGPVQCNNCQTIGHKSFQSMMSKTLSILQLNVRKREPVQQSWMNDVGLKDYGVLAVSEPYAIVVDGRVVTSPMWHSNWTKLIPTQRHDALWPVRSMLWVRSDLEAEQVPVPSADLTAAVLRLPERDVLVVSFRDGAGRRADVVLVGDFNRHDLLWAGDDVSARRQGEGEPIIDLMNEHGLRSLLPRETRTWQGSGQESTIDLILTTSELADEMMICAPHTTDHGSDHRAIQTTFDVALPERVTTPRLMFKNAPWNLIRTRADQLMRVVVLAIDDLTPRAEPTPYAKRWWTRDLTQLRRSYTFWRNQARVQRRATQVCSGLERRAKEAAKEYHDAIRRQRKAHWDDFLAEDTNIWKAAKYLEPGQDTMSDKVPPLKKEGGTMTRNRAEQAEQLLDTFFPPLPTRIEEEGLRSQRRAVAMPALTLEEVEVKVMAAKPWKAAGTDGLPAMMWRQLWPVVKHRVLALFQASLRDGVVPDPWRAAKIIPLKKPEKRDYTEAKAWRPISLLSTLGKTLEAVVAERISYVVETYGLLPANHFDLVQRRVKAAGGSIAFIDDYSAWVTGRTAEANRTGIQSIIDEAIDWEKRSGATFEVDKTTIVHFTRGTARNDVSFWIKGTEVKPKASAKILGVIMDSGLRYQEHMARAAQKGLTAAMNLRRLKLLSPRVARQLFMATVAPAMDYASNVWMHARRAKETGWLNKAQRIGAQAITGSFQTVATAVAEAEAGIRAVGEQHKQAATRLCVDLWTLPQTHPLAARQNKASKRSTERMEVIHEYALRPWTDRIPLLGEDDPEGAQTPYDVQNILIETAASQRNDVVGMGGVVCDTTLGGMGHTLATFIGPGSEQNPYTAELEAAATTLRSIPPSLVAQDVTIACTISGIYDQMKRLRKRGCTVRLMRVPVGEEEFAPRQLAKAAAKRATERRCEAEVPWYQTRTTTPRLALAQGRVREQLPEGVGRYSKRIGQALPGKHTRTIYDSLKREESDVLAQLRTGMVRQNSYLLCDCGQATETVEHFLFRRKNWMPQLEILLDSDEDFDHADGSGAQECATTNGGRKAGGDMSQVAHLWLGESEYRKKKLLQEYAKSRDDKVLLLTKGNIQAYLGDKELLGNENLSVVAMLDRFIEYVDGHEPGYLMNVKL